MKIIPFGWLPAAWGLKGPQREEAKAYYELAGYDLDLRLAEIRSVGDDYLRRKLELDLEYGLIDEYNYDVGVAKIASSNDLELSKKVLSIKHKHGMITAQEHDLGLAELMETDKEIAILEVKAHYGEITQNEADKEIATIRGEAWVSVINDGLRDDGSYFMEFDWNEQWITQLTEAGYLGVSDEEIIDKWFRDLCRNELLSGENSLPIGS